MTYIVGIRHNGLNSILSDLRVTYSIEGKKGRNTALKIGELLPGCIFGWCGNEKAGRDFILAAKYQIGRNGCISKFWEDFLLFTKEYEFSKEPNQRFELLLSCRINGQPQFFLLDSYNGLIKKNETIITIGSGKPLLDKLVFGEYQKKARQFEKILSSKEYAELKREIPPYLFAFWLSQLTRSQYRALLEKHGVGGIFHFVSQSGTQTFFQKPSKYILCSYDNKTRTIYPWQYSIFSVDYWLVVVEATPKWQSAEKPDGKFDLYAFLDEAALPPSPKGWWNPEELYAKLKESYDRKIEDLPYFHFYAVGYTNPIENPRFGITFGPFGEQLFPEKGVHSVVLKWLGIDI